MECRVFASDSEASSVISMAWHDWVINYAYVARHYSELTESFSSSGAKMIMKRAWAKFQHVWLTKNKDVWIESESGLSVPRVHSIKGKVGYYTLPYWLDNHEKYLPRE